MSITKVTADVLDADIFGEFAPKGTVLNYARSQHSSVILTPSVTIPRDTSIPQSSEGYGYTALDTTITPTRSDSKLRITGHIVAGETSNYGAQFIVALFRDSGINAIYSIHTLTDANAATGGEPAYLNFETDAISTSATTFKVRIGYGNASGTIRINDSGQGGHDLGNTLTSFLMVEEIKQ